MCWSDECCARELPSLTVEAPGMWHICGTSAPPLFWKLLFLRRGSTAGLPERLHWRERFYIPEEAGRGQAVDMSIFVAFPARFGHAGRRAGVKAVRPGRAALRPV